MIKLPPFVGQFVAHGLVVIFLRAGDEMMPLVTLVVVLQERHVHPPFACGLVAEEDDIVLVFTDLHDITLEVVALQGGDVILTHGEAFDEIPNHLGDEVSCARVDVVVGVVFEEADRRELVAQSGLTRHAAGLFTVEAVGRGVFHARGVGGTDGRDVETQEVGIADKWLGQFDVLLDVAQTIGIEEQLFHQLNILCVNIIRLVADVGEVEQEIGLVKDDMA